MGRLIGSKLGGQLVVLLRSGLHLFEDPGLGSPDQLFLNTKILQSETVGPLPIIAVFVTAVHLSVVENLAGLCGVLENSDRIEADANAMNGVVGHVEFPFIGLFSLA